MIALWNNNSNVSFLLDKSLTLSSRSTKILQSIGTTGITASNLQAAILFARDSAFDPSDMQLFQVAKRKTHTSHNFYIRSDEQPNSGGTKGISVCSYVKSFV